MVIVQARDVRPLLLAFPSEVLGAVLPPRHDVLLAIAVNVVEGSPLNEGDPQPCRQQYRHHLETNTTQMVAISRRLTMRRCHPQHAKDVAERRRSLADADARAQ